MKLHIAKDFSLPIDAVTQTFAILAKRRVGKTYTASVMAEEFVKANLPFVVLDPMGAWWGLRSGKDGKKDGGLPVYVIGGEHGIPLEPTAGKVIAEQVAMYPSFYVIDVSQFDSNAAQDRFATDFGERLFRIKEKHREPLHLFIDEADSFIPQRPMPGQQRMLGAYEALVRRGGLRGIGVTLISQRPAIVNKNVLTQSEILIVLQTTAPQDQDAIEDWIKRNGTEEKKKILMASLASLQKGEAWIWSPAWLEVFKRINIRERDTFNSSATPTVGKKVLVPSLAPVNLEKLSKQIQDTIEKVKENDPEALKRKIRELQQRAPKVDETATSKAVERMRRDTLLENVQQLKTMEAIISKQQNAIKKVVEVLTGLNLPQVKIIEQKHNIPIILDKVQVRGTIHQPKYPKGLTQTGAEDLEIRLREGARRMLAALIQWSPEGMTEGQMRSHAGLKKSGTYSAYKSDLKKFGFLEERGEFFYATQAGMDWLGHDIPSPKTTQEVMDIWLPKLRLGARRMLQILVEKGGEKMTDEQLQLETDLANSGTYSAYKTDLRTANLIIVDRGLVWANKDTLFL